MYSLMMFLKPHHPWWQFRIRCNYYLIWIWLINLEINAFLIYGLLWCFCSTFFQLSQRLIVTASVTRFSLKLIMISLLRSNSPVNLLQKPNGLVLGRYDRSVWKFCSTVFTTELRSEGKRDSVLLCKEFCCWAVGFAMSWRTIFRHCCLMV